MRALVATHDDDTLVELREVDEPAAAPHEAVVEVRAFSLNRGELSLLTDRPPGWRPGQDIAGVVARQADDGSGPPVGTRVVALVDGAGWSQRAAAPTERLAALPDTVTFAQAAALPVAGLTALRALRVGGALLGRRVLITGASGGVGSFAVELAAGAGAYVTGVVSNPERATGVRERGAADVVSSVAELEGKEPFHLVLESVGGASLTGALRHTAPDGTVVVFGASSGDPTTLGFYDFAGRPRARIYGFFVYDSGDRETFGDDLLLLAELVAADKLHPRIGLEDDWGALARGAAALRERRVAGKAVFQVS